MSRVYISDTNIWVDFRNAGLLDEIFQLPLTLCCTDFVLAELEDFDHEALTLRGLVVESLGAESAPKLSVLIEAHNNSSLADVSCYLFAKELGHPLLTGDGRLRKQAQKDGIEVHGALWLLDQLVAHGIIANAHAANALEAMLARGARLPASECQARLSRWRT